MCAECPRTETHLLPIFQNNNATWCQAKEVFNVVLPLKNSLKMHPMNSLADDQLEQEQWL